MNLQHFTKAKTYYLQLWATTLLRHGRQFWLPRDFGAEHFAVSMQVGEQVLFPRVRAAKPDEIIVASGTSCRHPRDFGADGTGKKALHVVEVMVGALA